MRHPRLLTLIFCGVITVCSSHADDLPADHSIMTMGPTYIDNIVAGKLQEAMGSFLKIPSAVDYNFQMDSLQRVAAYADGIPGLVKGEALAGYQSGTCGIVVLRMIVQPEAEEGQEAPPPESQIRPMYFQRKGPKWYLLSTVHHREHSKLRFSLPQKSHWAIIDRWYNEGTEEGRWDTYSPPDEKGTKKPVAANTRPEVQTSPNDPRGDEGSDPLGDLLGQ